MINEISNDDDKQDKLLNCCCLSFPSLLFLAIFFLPNSFPGFYFLFWGYWMIIPVSLCILIFSRMNKYKAAAKCALIGFILPNIIIPFLPSVPIPYGHP
jgi:hypothetical protein